MPRKPKSSTLPTGDLTELTCTNCGETKPISEFHTRKYQRTDGSLSVRPRRDCKECVRARSRMNGVRYREASGVRDAIWARKIRREFGLSAEEYGQMLGAQDGVCLLCGKNGVEAGRVRLAVDHCHSTGLLRGLLCGFCNRQLGWVEGIGLSRIVAYLTGELSPFRTAAELNGFTVPSSPASTGSFLPTAS